MLFLCKLHEVSVVRRHPKGVPFIETAVKWGIHVSAFIATLFRNTFQDLRLSTFKHTVPRIKLCESQLPPLPFIRAFVCGVLALLY